MAYSPKKIALALVSGVLVSLVWGFCFWGYLYDPLRVYNDLPTGVSQAADVMSRSEVATGTYFVPWPRNTAETEQKWLEAHRRGPFFQLQYVREGADPQSVPKFLLGILHCLVVTALAVGLCSFGKRSERTPSGNFWLVLTAGLMGSIYCQLDGPIWFNLPWRHSLVLLGYDLGSWLLMGDRLRHFSKKKRAAC